MKKLIAFFVDNSLLANWLMILIFAAGTFGLLNLQKRIWPKIEFDYISINLSWPGASAREVEEGMILPLEEQLQGLEGIMEITSSAYDGGGWFGLETSPWYPMDKLLDKVRSAVETSPEYPADAEKPVIYQETEWNRVMLLFIYGTDNLKTLEEVAGEFREDLIRTGNVTQINTWGFPGEQIVIEPLSANLERYGLTLEDIQNAVQSSSLNLSAGSILTGQEEIQIRTYEKKTTIPELEEIILSATPSGGTLYLKDLCTVRTGREENEVYTRANGREAVGLQIMYSNTEDVIEISKIVDAQLVDYREKYKDSLTFQTYIRDVDELNDRLGTLARSGMMGLVLVVLILGLFLNTRLSFWVALGIPISFMGLIFLEWMMKITINEMSLFGMIMIIGILVDDGIVIGESIYDQWHRLGKTRRQAAIDGTMEVISPVLISIATTMVAFVPYFYIYGEMGKYTRQIGMVVIASLAFSLVEALILLPAHLAHSKSLTDSARNPGKLRRKLEVFQYYLIHRIYSPFLNYALSNRAVILTILGCTLMISVGAVMGNHIRAAFFPDIEAPYVYAQVQFPSGTSSDVIDAVREDMEAFALQFGKDYVGDSKKYDNAIADYLSWGNSNQIFVYLILQDNKVRDFTVNSFSLDLAREFPEYPQVESLFIGNDSMFGGDPVSIRFLGREKEQLELAADLFKEKLRGIKGVKDIRDDMPLGQKEFLLTLNNRGRALGLTTAGVVSQLRMGFYGSELMTIQEGRNRIPVLLRYPLMERDSLNRVENLLIKTPEGTAVRLKEVADFTLQRSERSIRRENGYRSLRVMAGVDTEVTEINLVMKEVNEIILPEILSRVEGVSLSKGGQAAWVDKMIRSMIFSMALALLVMFTLLLFQMKSWGQALLVLSLIPLGFLGALYGHIIMGKPISFISFLGSVALGGIIVNDSVVLIDCFNKKIRSGSSSMEAAREAALQRFRPILMTTLTTSIGLGPLIFQKSVGGQMMVPVGISIAWGLIFGTFLTLAVLPVVLSMMKEKRPCSEPPASPETPLPQELEVIP